MFLPLLDDNYGTSAKTLDQRLADDPNFFCHIIQMIFRSKKDEKPSQPQSAEEEARATNAYRLLMECLTGIVALNPFRSENFSRSMSCSLPSASIRKCATLFLSRLMNCLRPSCSSLFIVPQVLINEGSIPHSSSFSTPRSGITSYSPFMWQD